jgi:hypothetical protein
MQKLLFFSRSCIWSLIPILKIFFLSALLPPSLPPLISARTRSHRTPPCLAPPSQFPFHLISFLDPCFNLSVVSPFSPVDLGWRTLPKVSLHLGMGGHFPSSQAFRFVLVGWVGVQNGIPISWQIAALLVLVRRSFTSFSSVSLLHPFSSLSLVCFAYVYEEPSPGFVEREKRNLFMVS